MLIVKETPIEMRKGKQTAEEILAAEKAKDDRQKNRGKGFKMMSQRDKGWVKLRNYAGGEVSMEWPVDVELEEYVPRRNIPEGKFVLTYEGSEIILDAEEVRKSLRWV